MIAALMLTAAAAGDAFGSIGLVPETAWFTGDGGQRSDHWFVRRYCHQQFIMLNHDEAFALDLLTAHNVYLAVSRSGLGLEAVLAALDGFYDQELRRRIVWDAAYRCVPGDLPALHRIFSKDAERLPDRETIEKAMNMLLSSDPLALSPRNADDPEYRLDMTEDEVLAAVALSIRNRKEWDTRFFDALNKYIDHGPAEDEHLVVVLVMLLNDPTCGLSTIVAAMGVLPRLAPEQQYGVVDVLERWFGDIVVEDAENAAVRDLKKVERLLGMWGATDGPAEERVRQMLVAKYCGEEATISPDGLIDGATYRKLYAEIIGASPNDLAAIGWLFQLLSRGDGRAGGIPILFYQPTVNDSVMMRDLVGAVRLRLLDEYLPVFLDQ